MTAADARVLFDFPQREGDLKPHAPVGVAGQFEDAVAKFRHRIEPRFGKPHRVFTDAADRVG